MISKKLRLLKEQCEELNSLTGRNFSVKAFPAPEGREYALYEGDSNYGPFLTPKMLGYWMDAIRRGFEIAKAKTN